MSETTKKITQSWVALLIKQVMIDRVERLVLNDRQIKVAKLAPECGISSESVYIIIHYYLGIPKVSARWVPKTLNMQDVSKGWSQVKKF